MKIVLSLTAHESIDCFHDLIENIRRCFIHYKILVLVSMTESLYTLYRPKYSFVKVVTRRNEYNIWGTIHLFHQHMLHLKYLKNIRYDYFWFVASNEMFIKVIPPTFLHDYRMSLTRKLDLSHEKDYEAYYASLKEHTGWVELCKKDTHFMNYVYTHKYTLTKCNHEGLVLPYAVAQEILKEYTVHQLYEKSTFPHYVMEEFFIPTYLFSKYTMSHFPQFCYHYMYDLKKYATYDEICTSLSPFHVSVKPVPRQFHHPLRVRIRNHTVKPV